MYIEMLFDIHVRFINISIFESVTEITQLSCKYVYVMLRVKFYYIRDVIR